jgi:hypothetical protein
MVLHGVAAADELPRLREMWSALRDTNQARGLNRFDVVPLTRVAGLCETLATLRPFAHPIGDTRRPLVVRLDVGAARLRPDAKFDIAVTMGDFPGSVRVDYMSFAENAVLHAGLAVPRVASQPNPLPQSVQLNALESAKLFHGDAGSPGEDLVIAIATRAPLFAVPRPDIENIADYLVALRGALRGRPPGGVAVHVIPVVIEKP